MSSKPSAVSTILPPPCTPDPTPKRRSESFSQYLRRSTDGVATAVREIVNAWIGKYPEQNRDQLARRLRASKQFESAFFELFMHELLHKLGYVVEAHPPVQSGSAKRPDFCLKGPANEVCYLEATLATDEPESSRSADSLKEEPPRAVG